MKDRSTSDLMRTFYENLLLLHGQGRAEALHNVQLAMLAANRASEGDALPRPGGRSCSRASGGNGRCNARCPAGILSG